MTEETPFAIPESWTWKPFDEVAEINPTLDRDQIEEDPSVSFVPMKRVEELSGQIDLSETRPISEVASRYTYFAEGDVIFAKITPCMENGKTAIAKGLENGVGFGSTEFHVVRPSDDLLNSWAFYYLIQEGFRRDAKRRMTGSAGQKRVPTSYMEKVQLPVPPLPEQRRIVAKIEELSSDLEAGVADLKRAQQQLQRYRQSVLQAAVEGRLTKDWRNQHDTEPADKLLERILEERQAQWAKDYRAKYEAKGKEPPSGWKSRYKPAEEPDVSDLPELPKGWTWVSLDQILREDLRNGKSVRSKEGGFPVLRLTSLENGRIETDEHKEGDWTRDEAAKFIIKQGDFYVARGNGSLRLVGRGGLVEKTPIEVAFPDTMIRVRINRRRYKSGLLGIVWDSSIVRNHLESAARTSAGIYKVNQGDLRSTVLPLPPQEEQHQIVNEVERLLSMADEAAQTVEREIKRAERLRQSILKQAFSGQLVEQHDAVASSNGASPALANAEGEQIEMAL